VEAAGEMKDLFTARDAQDERALVEAAADGDLVLALLAVESMREAHDAVNHTLDQLADEVLEAEVDGLPALAQVLGQRHGFRGSVERYHDVENSHLTRVLERKRGMPILLSAVWIAVGRRADLDVQGVGLPGHFIVSHGPDYADPFEGGRALTETQCRDIAARFLDGPVPDAALRRVSVRELTARVLRNLLHGLQTAGDEAGAYRASRLLAALEPANPEARLRHARAVEAIGSPSLVREAYQGLVRDFVGSPLAAFAQERLAALPTTDECLH
jgi:regulator of sirC expression with transglutaminase-like and TPR domain